MTKKLSEILGSRQGVDLEFVGLQTDETREGETLVRLILKNNIPVVYGRQITDPVTNDRVRLEVTDVEMVTINPQALKAIEAIEEAELLKPENERNMPFTWTKEGESGRLKCNLKLDVSNNQEVWVVTESFGKFAANRRTERQNAQRSSLVAKIREAKTKEEFKGVGVNDKPVVTA